MSAVHKETPEATAQRIQWHLCKVHDGLSIDHLAKLMARNTLEQIHSGLRWLKATEEACQGGNGWWYSLTDPQFLAPDHSFTPPIEETPMTDSHAVPLSVADRLHQWLLQRKPDDAPLYLTDLAVVLATNSNTLSKALKTLTDRLTAQGKTELVKELHAAALKKPSVPPIRKAAVPSSLPVAAEGDWVTELKQQLLATTRLENERRTEWKETLFQLDSVLKELGVADHQRSRRHLREIHKWLSQEDGQ
jgi:hypothetical protein